MKENTSYWITPEGVLHEVQRCYHDQYAEKYIRENYPEYANDSIFKWPYYAQDYKELIVAKFGWVSFQPLGTNTVLGYIGCLSDNIKEIRAIRMTKAQLKAIEELWEINQYEPVWLERLLARHEEECRVWNPKKHG